MARVMVTGATGLLGRAVVKRLQQAGHEVIATGFSRATNKVHKLDLTSAQAVADFVRLERPHIIVHCAAERRPDVSERHPEAALALNLDASQALANAAKAQHAWLLYVSTDYVFDGTQPPYAEDSVPNPVNFYGQSKRQGEQLVLDTLADSAVLRLPLLYGQVESIAESAVFVLIKQLLDTRVQAVDHWAMRRPTSTADISHAITQMITQRLAGKSLVGIYHFSAQGGLTKYQMLLKLGDIFGLTTQHLKPETTPTGAINRPQDCSLSCQRLADLGIVSQLDFATGVRMALALSPAALTPHGLAFSSPNIG